MLSERRQSQKITISYVSIHTKCPEKTNLQRQPVALRVPRTRGRVKREWLVSDRICFGVIIMFEIR